MVTRASPSGRPACFVRTEGAIAEFGHQARRRLTPDPIEDGQQLGALVLVEHAFDIPLEVPEAVARTVSPPRTAGLPVTIHAYADHPNQGSNVRCPIVGLMKNDGRNLVNSTDPELRDRKTGQIRLAD